MPRAFLVKKSPKLNIDDAASTSSENDQEPEINKDDDKEDAQQRNTQTMSDSNEVDGACTETNVKVTKNMDSARSITLPFLTIPKPFQDRPSTNVLRSILYQGSSSALKNDKSVVKMMPRLAEPSHASGPPTLLMASAHSAFDKVTPGDISARTNPSKSRVSLNLAPKHTPSMRIAHLSHSQLEKQRYEQSVLKENASDSTLPVTFRQREDNAIRSTQSVNINPSTNEVSQSGQPSDEPLNLKITRDEEIVSRPHSVESNSNSRDSLSPTDEAFSIRHKHIFNRHERFDHPDSTLIMNNMFALRPALRTPNYTPSLSSLGHVIPHSHLNWAYAAYYQQAAQYGAPYATGHFYPRENRYSVPPNGINLLHQSLIRPFNTTPISTSHKADILEINPDIKPRLSTNSSPMSTQLEEPEDNPESPTEDNLNHKEPSALKPEYREHLTDHLKNIRKTTYDHLPPVATTRPIARQPVLGLEYIQNGTDVKVNEDMDEHFKDMMNNEDDKELDNDDFGEMKSVNMISEKDELELQMETSSNINDSTNPLVISQQTFDVPTLPTPSAKPPQPKKYKCDVCFKGFSRSNTLVTHKRIHTGDKPFKCELCGRAFRQPGNLTRHRLTHTTVKPYVCPQCNKAFNRASNLHTHMRTHTNYKPFSCPYCGKGFHQKIDMKIHSYTHTGEKPHKCKTCGRGFKQLTHLTYHMRTHSAVKMYTCAYCGKGFNQKGNLQAHIYGHTGERPYRCEICDKGFTLASTLNTHRRTHAEKKPYQCQYCQKDFYQKNALKSHLIASHPYTGESLL